MESDWLLKTEASIAYDFNSIDCGVVIRRGRKFNPEFITSFILIIYPVSSKIQMQ